MRPIAFFVKPWQRIVGARPNAGGGTLPGSVPEAGGDSRGAFGDLRESLQAELEREPGSPLLTRASFEVLVGAFVTRAQQSRGAIGLVAFELEDWKVLHERAGASAFAGAFADISRELRRRMRASDELGRLGEAQIAAILPDCEVEALDGVSQRLRLALEAREVSLGAEPVRPTFVSAWLPAPGGSAPANPVRLLEDLEHVLERMRRAAPT